MEGRFQQIGSPPRRAHAGRPPNTVSGRAANLSIGLAPFAGRQSELHQMTAVASAPPAIIVVEGEAGMGKTRLIQEMLRSPALLPMRHLLGQSLPSRSPSFLGPIVDALHELNRTGALPPRLPEAVGLLRDIIPELAPLLPSRPNVASDSRVLHHSYLRAVRQLLASLGPTVLVLEQMQWADHETIEALLLLISRMPRTVTLVLSYRPLEVPGTPASTLVSAIDTSVHNCRIVVEPLSSSDVERISKAALRVQKLPQRFVEEVYGSTGGVPFVVDEFLRTNRPILSATLGGWGNREPALPSPCRVPTAVQNITMRRCARLSRDARVLVQSAAILGGAVNGGVLADVSGLPTEAVAAALDEALRSALLVDIGLGHYGFQYGLAEKAVYDSIEPGERHRLHLAAGMALEGLEATATERLCRHFRDAGNFPRWRLYASRAARESLSRFAYADAASYLYPLVADPRMSPSDLQAIAPELASIVAHGGLPPEHPAVAWLSEYVQRAGVPAPVRGEVRWRLAFHRCGAGFANEGYREQEAALRELRAQPTLAVHAMLHLARPWVEAGTLPQHLTWLRRARKAATRCEGSQLRRAIDGTEAVLLTTVGDPAGWQAALRLEGGVRRSENWWDLLLVAGACLDLGHDVRAAKLLRDLRRAAEAASFELILGPIESLEILARWFSGAWDGLRAAASTQALAACDVPSWSLPAMVVEGSLHLASGHWERARAQLRWCVRVARSAGSIALMARASAELARVELAVDDASSAARVAQDAVDVIAEKGIWVWGAATCSVAVEAACRVGDESGGAGLTSRLERGIRDCDAPAARAELLACWGLVNAATGKDQAARAAFADAALMWRRLRRPYAEARVRRLLADHDLRTRHPRAHRDAVASLRMLEALGAVGDSRRLRSLIQSNGLRLSPAPRSPGRPGFGDELTPRQREIAAKAALGLSHREIAQQLGLSVKTIDVHLAAAKRKLGLRPARTLLSERLERRTGSSTLGG